MTEKHMQTLFGKHLQKHPPKQTEVYELKITKDSYISFDRLQDHQITGLGSANDAFLYHKIADTPVSWGMRAGMRFTAKKPFDCFVLVQAPAFVVIWFYKPRAKKVFIKVSIANFMWEKRMSPRKSLTEERALEIGEILEINIKD